MKEKHYLITAIVLSFVVSNVIAIFALASNGLFISASGRFTLLPYLRWMPTIFVTAMLFNCVVMSHKFAKGRFQEILFVVSALLLIAEVLSYLVFALVECKFNFVIIDWFGSFDVMCVSGLYYLFLIIIFGLLFTGYCTIINKHFLSIFSKNGPYGKLKQVKDSNLENPLSLKTLVQRAWHIFHRQYIDTGNSNRKYVITPPSIQTEDVDQSGYVRLV